MASVNFYLKAADTSGLSLVYLQVAYNNKKFIYSFGESIKANQWNTKKQRVKDALQKDSSGVYFLNDKLDKIETAMQYIFRKESVNGIPRPEVLKAYLNTELKRTKKDNDGFWELLERFTSGEIRDEKTQQKKEPGTLRHYKVVEGRLRDFQKDTKYIITFESINRTFLEKFIQWMSENKTIRAKGEKKEREREALSANTQEKAIKTIKLFMGRALRDGLTDNKQFEQKWFSVSGKETEDIALSRLEVSKILNHKYSTKQLEETADLFVLACNTGLRISDFSKIQEENIIEREGKIYIQKITKKVGEHVIIPAHPDVLKIFKKYQSNSNRLPKAPADQTFNKRIKEAAKEAGLTERGRIASEPKTELWELISSHTGRRSLATNLYKEGIPVSVIMRITGHKTEAAFFKYIKIGRAEAADIVSAHFDRKGVLKIV